MPRQCSLKSLCVETVMFIGIFALVGHLSVNFWERYVYQNELANMKYSLHTMKKTINHIGNAYDDLQKEIQGIIEIAERKSAMTVIPKKSQEQQCKHVCNLNLDQRKLHDLQNQANIKGKKDQAESTRNDEDKCCKKNSKISFAIGQNATTITRNPPASKAVGTEPVHCQGENNSRCRYRETYDNNMHRCYKDYDYCGRSYNHLKF